MSARERERTGGGWSAFAGATDGVSAIEFAFIAPVLILLLLGVSDFVPSFVARFKAAHANGSFGDLVAQSSALQTSDLEADYAAAIDVMTPFATDTLALRVTNVYSDGNGHAYVYWSCGQGALPPLAARSQVTTTPTGTPVSSLLNLASPLITLPVTVPILPNQPNGTNTSYVMTESNYTYAAPAQFLLTGEQTMTSAVFLYPRQSAYIGFPWGGDPNKPPPKPTSTKKSASLTLANGARCSYATT